jgi:hypothetical protein
MDQQSSMQSHFLPFVPSLSLSIKTIVLVLLQMCSDISGLRNFICEAFLKLEQALILSY